MSTADNSQNQKLRFRIVECSGEDPQHPVSELLTGSPQSSGWQSQRFCTFPQYITFQFMTPVRLKQLQFLSHENKIPTKLELYTSLGDYKSNLSLNDTKFKKLGYLSLDTNEKSGFTLRELKTVYIEAPCVYLRIIFEKCHINKFNFFNQVGLIAIAAFGEPVTQSPGRHLNHSALERNERNERAEPVSKTDEFVIRKLRELEGSKFRAIDREEFEEAHFIKQEILKVKQIGAQLQRFEERKLVAMENEDFETATNLKREIERLRDAVSLCGTSNSPDRNKNGYAPPSKPEKSLATYNSYEQGSQKGSLAEIPEPRLSAHKKPNPKEPKPQKSLNSKPTNNWQDDEQEEEKYAYEDEGEDEEYDDYRNSSTRVAYEDQIIPALLKKAGENNSIENEEFSQLNMPQEAEKLSPTNQKLAEHIIPIIGEELCQKVFSKHWNLREDALKTLIPEISKQSQSNIINYNDPGITFVALLGVINYTVVDRINQVATKALTLLKNVMTLKPNMANTTSLKNDLTIYTDNIVNCLLERLGDSTGKIREQAEDTYLSMVRNPVISCNFCVNALSRIHAGRGKSGQTVRHILTKLRLLHTIIKEFKINNHDVPYSPVMEYIVEKVEHPNNEIRAAVVQLLVEIFTFVGDKIRGDLENVSLVYREAIEKEFEVIAPKHTPSKLLTKENSNKVNGPGGPSNKLTPGVLSKKGSLMENKPIKIETATGAGGNPKTSNNANNPSKLDFSSSKGKTEGLPSINGAKNGSAVPGGNPKTEAGSGKAKEEDGKTPKKGKKEAENKGKTDPNTSIGNGANSGKQEAVTVNKTADANGNGEKKSPPAGKKSEELPKIPNNNQVNQQTGKAK